MLLKVKFKTLQLISKIKLLTPFLVVKITVVRFFVPTHTHLTIKAKRNLSLYSLITSRRSLSFSLSLSITRLSDETICLDCGKKLYAFIDQLVICIENWSKLKSLSLKRISLSLSRFELILASWVNYFLHIYVFCFLFKLNES